MIAKNRLFVINKPKGISSNFYLKKIKWRYKVKKAGFSGILDPFADGCLITAFGQYSKLFRFFKKTPKTYRATLWLGAKSESLDNENITEVLNISPFSPTSIEIVFQYLKGEISYHPPKFSAKRVGGVRAYKMAREQMDFELPKITSTIYDSKILHYCHPFLTFEITASEGTYIRSIGQIISKKLGFNGVLSSLTRINEGKFKYENEKNLNPIEYLNTDENFYLADKSDMILGKKLSVENFKIQDDGIYHLVNENYLAIIKIENSTVSYMLNNILL